MDPRPRRSVSIQFAPEKRSGAGPDLVAIGPSPVNLVVVCRIAERVGVRALSITNAVATEKIGAMTPKILVIDGGPDGRACDDLAAAIAEKRRATGGKPFVVFLSGRPRTTGGSALELVVDRIVAKPFTPDHLQPVLVDLLRR